MDCIEKAKVWITGRGLFEPGTRIVAAVSGGPDSMAMLTILARLSPSMRLELAAAHFDHMIRPGSGREGKIVERHCARLGIPLFSGSGDVPAEARRSRRGIEETARELRYRFLEDTARRWQAQRVALGHNLDDQVETVMHHIIRGSGLRGLTGMPEKRGIFVRPVLSHSREELRSFLRVSGIRYAVDPSNRDDSIFRNRLRNRLLPYLRRNFNPSIDESLLRVSDNAAEALHTLSVPVEKTATSVRIEGNGKERTVAIALSKLAGLSDYQIYLFVDSVLREHFDVMQDVTRRHFDSVKQLLKSGSSGSRVRLPHGISVYRRQKDLKFAMTATEEPVVRTEVTIPREGTYALAPWFGTITVELLSGREGRALIGKGGSSGNAPAPQLDAVMAFAGFPLRVRQREAGDRLVPFGMKGRRKLSDILIDRKIDLDMRDRLPVFEDSAGIIWVPGVAAAERTRVTSATGRVIRITASLPRPVGGRGKKRM